MTISRLRASVTTSPLVATLIEDYLAAKRAENIGKLTLLSYARCLGYFREYVGPIGIADVTRDHIYGFLGWLRDEKRCAESTVRTKFTQLSCFWHWVEAEEPQFRNPMARMKAPKVHETEPDQITQDDYLRLLQTANGHGFKDRRDLAVLTLMYDTGIRVAGMADIRLEDIDVANLEVFVRTAKGGNSYRTTFGPNTCAKALRAYLRIRPTHPKALTDDHLFLSNMGGFGVKGIQYMLDRRCQLAGIPHVHPHMFRHAFGYAMKSGQHGDNVGMTLGNWRDRRAYDHYGNAGAFERAKGLYVSPTDALLTKKR